MVTEITPIIKNGILLYINLYLHLIHPNEAEHTSTILLRESSLFPHF